MKVKTNKVWPKAEELTFSEEERSCPNLLTRTKRGVGVLSCDTQLSWMITLISSIRKAGAAIPAAGGLLQLVCSPTKPIY